MSAESAPPVVLAIMYWLHMLATVVWIGGLTTMAIMVLPAAHRFLDPTKYLSFLSLAQSRLQWLGWFSLFVLTVTGMFQMSSNPSYEGFLAIHNPWSVAILAKHLVIGLMIITSAYMTWWVLPGLRRLSIQLSLGRLNLSETEIKKNRRQERVLLTTNLILSSIVLLLTALARATSGI